MKIKRIADLHADFGWRTASFLKVETDDGVVGWSEYLEGHGNKGLTGVIRALAEHLIGMNPAHVDRIAAHMNAWTLQASGGLNQQAIAAITNALLDVKAKSLGVPVHALFGGAIRERIPLYWSHCGSYRVRYPAFVGKSLKTYDDIARLGEEVRKSGFKALKTNMLMPIDGVLSAYRPATSVEAGFPAVNPNPAALASIRPQMEAFRAGAGPDVGLMLDVNFHFRTEGFLRVARATEDLDLMWLEMDSYDPAALATVRQASRNPIASCEAIFTRRAYRDFFDRQAVDVAIIDVIWNGYLEAIRIASLADTYEVNVAPHNYFGALADFMSASFAATVPNLRIMEIDVDSAPWKFELVTHQPTIENGEFVLADRPGWGTDINEAALKSHPPRG